MGEFLPAHAVSTVTTLASLLARFEAGTLAASELPSLVGALEEVKARLWTEMMTPKPNGTPDRLLTATEAAERLNLSKDTLYRRADDFPFTVRIGRKVRYSSNGIDRHIASLIDIE